LLRGLCCCVLLGCSMNRGLIKPTGTSLVAKGPNRSLRIKKAPCMTYVDVTAPPPPSDHPPSLDVARARSRVVTPQPPCQEQANLVKDAQTRAWTTIKKSSPGWSSQEAKEHDVFRSTLAVCSDCPGRIRSKARTVRAEGGGPKFCRVVLSRCQNLCRSGD